MVKLSVVVSSFNSENTIEECLKSVSFADEIIVVDGTSLDKTLDIAKRYASKILVKPNNLMLNVNKNFGFSKAKGDWILSLDSDERITKELKEEILSTLNSLPSRQAGQLSTPDGYWIPRKNIIFGKWIEHKGWYPDNQLRLFRNGKGKFAEQHVHEMVKVDGEVGHLKNSLIHNNYSTVSQFFQKTGEIYAPNEADQILKNGYIFDWRDSIRFPLKEFLSRFFAREGYKDGLHGLILSMLMAFYHLIVFVNIWEKQKFNAIDERDFLENTEKEMKNGSREIFFWFSKEKIAGMKNPLSKTMHKIFRKVRS